MVFLCIITLFQRRVSAYLLSCLSVSTVVSQRIYRHDSADLLS